jgi:hypothetical protein
MLDVLEYYTESSKDASDSQKFMTLHKDGAPLVLLLLSSLFFSSHTNAVCGWDVVVFESSPPPASRADVAAARVSIFTAIPEASCPVTCS